MGRPAWSRSWRAVRENGDPPLVLAVGSTAVMEPGRLIETFVQAAKRVGRRAVIQVGAEQRTSYRIAAD